MQKRFNADSFVTQFLLRPVVDVALQVPADDMAWAWAVFATRFGKLGVIVFDQCLYHVGFYKTESELCVMASALLEGGAESGKHGFYRYLNHAKVSTILEALSRAHLDGRPVSLAKRGTAFQQSVWRQLLSVLPGENTSYKCVASALGRPNAQRAVGSAIGANPWALIIPCHRVCRADGGVGGYRWGVGRKLKLRDFESQNCTASV